VVHRGPPPPSLPHAPLCVPVYDIRPSGERGCGTHCLCCTREPRGSATPACCTYRPRFIRWLSTNTLPPPPPLFLPNSFPSCLPLSLSFLKGGREEGQGRGGFASSLFPFKRESTQTLPRCMFGLLTGVLRGVEGVIGNSWPWVQERRGTSKSKS
jgi:hypothetical protein